MRCRLVVLLALLTGFSSAAGAEPISLHDTTLILEEAFRADAQVLQHAVALAGREWSYTLTHELAGETPHLLSWSLPIVIGEDGGQPALGAASLDYRYQIGGRDRDRYGFAPRVSLLLPVNPDANMSPGMSVAAPLTLAHGEALASHWNLSAAVVGEEDGSRSNEISAGAGFSRVINHRTVFVLEAVASWSRIDTGPVGGESRSVVVCPAVRRVVELGGVRLVPGLGLPITIEREDRSVGVSFHLMLENSLE